MAKFFFAALLAVIVAVSSAQSECPQRCGDVRFRQLLDRQLSGSRVVVPPWKRPSEPRAQCCQQLQDVSPECHCAAIRRMVRSYEQSLAPLEAGCSGETGGQQRGGYFGGERRRQQGGGCYSGESQQQEGGYYGGECGQQGGYCGETGRQQREEWHPKQNRGYIGCPPRTAGQYWA